MTSADGTCHHQSDEVNRAGHSLASRTAFWCPAHDHSFIPLRSHDWLSNLWASQWRWCTNEHYKWRASSTAVPLNFKCMPFDWNRGFHFPNCRQQLLFKILPVSMICLCKYGEKYVSVAVFYTVIFNLIWVSTTSQRLHPVFQTRWHLTTRGKGTNCKWDWAQTYPFIATAPWWQDSAPCHTAKTAQEWPE